MKSFFRNQCLAVLGVIAFLGGNTCYGMMDDSPEREHSDAETVRHRASPPEEASKKRARLDALSDWGDAAGAAIKTLGDLEKEFGNVASAIHQRASLAGGVSLLETYRLTQHMQQGIERTYGTLQDLRIWEGQTRYRWPGQTPAEFLFSERFLPRGLWEPLEGDASLASPVTLYKLTLCALWKDPLAMLKLAEHLELRFSQAPMNPVEESIQADKDSFLGLCVQLKQRANNIFQAVIANDQSTPHLRVLAEQYFDVDRSFEEKEAAIAAAFEAGERHADKLERLICSFERAREEEDSARRPQMFSQIIKDLEGISPEEAQLWGPYTLKKLRLSYVERLRDTDDDVGALVAAGDKGSPVGFALAAQRIANEGVAEGKEDEPYTYWMRAAERGYIEGYRQGAEFYLQKYRTVADPDALQKAQSFYKILEDHGAYGELLSYADFLKERGSQQEAFPLYLKAGHIHEAGLMAHALGQTYEDVMRAYVVHQTAYYNDIKEALQAMP